MVVTAISTLLVAATACESRDLPSMTCRMDGTPEGIAQRPSPFDSVVVSPTATVQAKLCYSRPQANGRTIFGELVPYDTLWRTGANEPTILHVSTPAVIAGVPVEPGNYSIYTVPSRGQWIVVVNASTSQWGLTQDAYGAEGNFFPNAYTEEVRAQEVGRAPIETREIEYTESLTASLEPSAESAYNLYFDWERTRVVIPVRLLGSSD